MSLDIALASNQGDIGGGEVMLLHIAHAARDLGHEVTIVAPESPGSLAATARGNGYEVVTLRSSSTLDHLRNLRRWATREKPELLWCNGLRPSFATSGLPGRIVHLHQVPTGKQTAAARTARRGALTTLVPSQFAARRIPGANTLLNWTDDPADAPATPRTPATGRAATIGYLGRLSLDKGVDVLVRAIEHLVEEGRDVRLLLAGEARFVDPRTRAQGEDALSRLGARVIRRGWMDRDTFFGAVDVACFPSAWAECFGLVAAEAMAARCPFVVSDAGALPEVVGDDYPYVAARGDAHSLATSIVAALDALPGECAAVLERSHERWQRRYSPEAGRERVAQMLDGLGLTGGTA